MSLDTWARLQDYRTFITTDRNRLWSAMGIDQQMAGRSISALAGYNDLETGWMDTVGVMVVRTDVIVQIQHD